MVGEWPEQSVIGVFDHSVNGGTTKRLARLVGDLPGDHAAPHQPHRDSGISGPQPHRGGTVIRLENFDAILTSRNFLSPETTLTICFKIGDESVRSRP